MPMNYKSVVIYLAIILAGYVIVSIADSFAAREISTRLKISSAKLIFTQVYSLISFGIFFSFGYFFLYFSLSKLNLFITAEIIGILGSKGVKERIGILGTNLIYTSIRLLIQIK